MTVAVFPKRYDVIVVGMGPAGASAALELSQRGFSVLAFDKQMHPRYKVCGGGLSARIARVLPADFHSVVEKTVYRVQFACGTPEPFLIESSKPIAYMVMRSRFDHWLLEKARQAGTEIHEAESVGKIVNGSDGVEVSTELGCYRGRVVIGADGVMSTVAQQCFGRRAQRTIPALESEVQGASLHASQEPPVAVISLQAAKKGYGWIFPKRDGFSVGLGEFVKGTQRPKQSFQYFTQRQQTLAGLKISTPLGHPLPLATSHLLRKGTGWSGQLVNGCAMLVGDAGHLVDPLLGEGIYYAVWSGQLAAKTVAQVRRNPAAHQLSEYEVAVEDELGPEFRVADRLGKIVYGLPQSMHRWAGQRFPGAYHRVLQRYCAMLQGKETYQSFWNRILQRLHWPLVPEL